MDNDVRNGISNWLVASPPSWAVSLELLVHSINQCSPSHSWDRPCNFSVRGNHLAFAATQGITCALLAWGRLGHTNAATVECDHRRACKVLADYDRTIATFHWIYDYFALLKAFNSNSVNFHQYFKDKLSSHQPFHMHNTRHRTNGIFNSPLFHSKIQKCYLF